MIKLQDLAFLLVFVAVLLLRSWKLAAIIGIVALLFAIPLFKFWVFFTAERLTWYSGAFFLISVITLSISKKK